ncbi:MAG TPA: kelch repeat-containing protein [Thermoanaerobaculia bacterium]|jgi:hypothetical protein
MSVSTPKRAFLSVFAVLLLSTPLFASAPSPRAHARLVFDKSAGVGVLFGGQSANDTATAIAYQSDETWIWTGFYWVQRFPQHHPAGRSAHGMVYDSNRQRVVLFGGRKTVGATADTVTFHNDTWIWQNDDWTQLATPNAPSPRALVGMAFDPLRDRVVLYGGNDVTGGKVTSLFDTWEFDGTNWIRYATDEPKVEKPLLTYDAARHEVIMVGTKDDLSKTTIMYRYDGAAHTWSPVAPAALPPCVNEAAMTFDESSNTIVLTGGVCTITTSTSDEVWQWNGENWVKPTIPAAGRATGQAIAYDSLRGEVVTFGGTNAFAAGPRSSTEVLRNNLWRFVFSNRTPAPRSLLSFVSDPVNRTIWLIGGLDEFGQSYIDDFWSYRNNQWIPQTLTNGPALCGGPVSAFDANRSRLVVACSGAEVYEWDGATWKSLTSKTKPPIRRFANAVYDASIKKVVLFGGWDGTDFRNDTWTWDGTTWTEIKKDRPTARASFAMWYDPLMQKTVIYGGIGRPNVDSRVTRYTDMYSFNGTGWSKLNVTATPGERFGPQVGVDPRTGKVLLVGGLRAELIGGKNEDARRQFFDNDTWEWDGSKQTWTRLSPASLPSARQNGGLAYDPIADRMVLFGGYAGFYFSDVWSWDGATWRPLEQPTGGRRRTVRGGSGSVPSPTSVIVVPTGTSEQ